MKRFWKNIGLYVIIFVIIVFTIAIGNRNYNPKETVNYTYSDLIEKIENGEIKEVDIQRSTDVDNYGIAQTVLSDGSKISVTVPAVTTFLEQLQDNDVKINVNDLPKTGVFRALLPSILMMILAIGVFSFIFQRMQGGGGGKVMNFGKSKAKPSDQTTNKVTFKDVAGLDEEKKELEEVVEFLKDPKKFSALGARIPKGVLLVGPPGTGKTLLAKAVAGESGVQFFSISGSDFVEMFVGVGASRVRDLFEQAKKNLPCIVFIDEIDAVGRRRGAGVGGGHDEREQTLNQLLVEMDGFGINEGVIVIAATNRADILDPAILRPGRFDRQVYVGRPDLKGRTEILKVHAKGKPLAEDINLEIVAKTTAGFTGADLENLLNEAALLSARDNKKKIDMEEIQKAFVKVGIGTEKKNRVISPREKKITAYHEAGHAILFELLPNIDPVHSISIIPTGPAGGYTMPLPTEDRMYNTKKQMEQEIISFLGGRAAEFIIMKDITTGASNDIERATSVARSMVTKFGMSDVLGPIHYGGEDSEDVFLGKELGHHRNYSDGVAVTIDKEIKKIMDHSYEEAKRLLSENIDILHATAKLLIEKEKITGDEFRVLFEKKDFENVVNEIMNDSNETIIDSNEI